MRWALGWHGLDLTLLRLETLDMQRTCRGTTRPGTDESRLGGIMLNGSCDSSETWVDYPNFSPLLTTQQPWPATKRSRFAV